MAAVHMFTACGLAATDMFWSVEQLSLHDKRCPFVIKDHFIESSEQENAEKLPLIAGRGLMVYLALAQLQPEIDRLSRRGLIDVSDHINQNGEVPAANAVSEDLVLKMARSNESYVILIEKRLLCLRVYSDGEGRPDYIAMDSMDAQLYWKEMAYFIKKPDTDPIGATRPSGEFFTAPWIQDLVARMRRQHKKGAR